MAFSAFERLVAVRYLRARRQEGFISIVALFSFIGIMLGVGVLIVTMIVLLASLTPMREASWWQDSAMMGFFEQLAEWLKGIIPDTAAESFKL